MRTARGNGEDSETSMRTLWQQQMHDTLHPPGAVRAISAALGAVLLFGLVLCSGVAAAQDALPRPPCGEGTPFPAYPAASAPGAAPAVVQAWQAGQGPRWTPPACTGWAAGPGQGFRTLVALAGRIQPAGSTDQVLGRFGAISMLRGVRYWSTSDGAWRPLASSASALDGPDPGRRRTDFTAAELRSGRDAYFVQHDSRSSSDVVYRMRVLESGADRIMVATENVTPVRLMVVTLFQPGALQVVHVLQRLSPTSWGYYGLLRTTQDRDKLPDRRPRSLIREPRRSALPLHRRRADRSRPSHGPVNVPRLQTAPTRQAEAGGGAPASALPRRPAIRQRPIGPSH